MEELERVTFILANGESVSIDKKHLGTFVLDEISESYETGISSVNVQKVRCNVRRNKRK